MRQQVLQDIGRLVLRTALDSLRGRRRSPLATPYFLRQTMSNDRELVLVAARKSRGSNHWDKDDYDVRRGHFEGPVIGRIFRSTVAPTTTPWFWTIIKLKPIKPTERGYAITREAAMSALMQAVAAAQ